MSLRLVLAVLVTVIVALPSPLVLAQQAKPHIGVLWPGDVQRWTDAFIEGLRENGYVDGTTASIDVRNTYSNFDSGPALAKELISLEPRVIFASPGTLAKHVLRELELAHKSIPVVVLTWDPIEEDVVAAAAHPGRNVTGIGTAPDPEFITKHLQLIKELVPQASRVGYFIDPSWYRSKFFERSSAVLDKAARQLGIKIITIEVQTPKRLEAAFSEAIRKQSQAVIVPPSPTFAGHRDRVIQLAAKNHLPAIYGDELFAYEGGLISYWTSISEMERHAGGIVARIARGATAADIPVEYPTRYRLVVNLKTASALGIEVPKSVLLQADEVIK